MQSAKTNLISSGGNKRLEELLAQEPNLGLGGSKKPVNYANYTKENYNILTLQQHNDYYKRFSNKVPVYVREQPDWNKSLFKRKTQKVNQYNYIIYRNAQEVRNRAANTSVAIPRSMLYSHIRRDGGSITGTNRQQRRGHKSFVGSCAESRPSKESLPLISKKDNADSEVSHSKTKSKVQEMCKRSLSSYCGGSKAKSHARSIIASSISGANPPLTETEKQIRRAEQLGKFMQSLGSEGTKQVATLYAKQLLEKLKASALTKEQMKIIFSKPPEEIEKMIEQALMGNNKSGEEKEDKSKEEVPAENADESKEKPKEGEEGKPVEIPEGKIKELETKIASLCAELLSLKAKDEPIADRKPAK